MNSFFFVGSTKRLYRGLYRANQLFIKTLSSNELERSSHIPSFYITKIHKRYSSYGINFIISQPLHELLCLTININVSIDECSTPPTYRDPPSNTPFVPNSGRDCDSVALKRRSFQSLSLIDHHTRPCLGCCH